MKLLRTFPKVSFEFGLASWQWLGLSEQTPRFATCFGDIFLESLDGWWFLDTVEGTLELRWTSAVTMYTELESAEGRATYLMDDLVRDARSRGIHLDEEDVYTFTPHPALGGELGVNGIGTMRFELAVNWVGQMHDQVLHSPGEINLPPMPDDGRRSPARQVTAAWDAAWSNDETFDVPFEQYLATTTFAAVSTPRHGISRHAATGPEQSVPSPAWSGDDGATWAGQTDGQIDDAGTGPTQPWQPAGPEHHQAMSPETYDASFDPHHAVAPEQYDAGPADQHPGAPYGEQDWLPYGSTSSPDEQDRTGSTWGNPAWGTSAPSGAAWGTPSWGSPWGGQSPAVAAGGNQQQTPRTDDPFTAWDDLWGKH